MKLHEIKLLLAEHKRQDNVDVKIRLLSLALDKEIRKQIDVRHVFHSQQTSLKRLVAQA